MKNKPQSTHERTVGAPNGWLMLLVGIICVVLVVVSFVLMILAANTGADGIPLRLLLILLLGIAAGLSFAGLFTLQPNEARVLVLFGAYRGTVRRAGFQWANPFYSRRLDKGGPSSKISLRARNFNSDKLKVNDSRGNPIEIAAVVVWRVADSAQAVFDVDDYESYVEVQSESAIRTIASRYAYDESEDDEVTLRGSTDEIAKELERELQARLDTAGVEVEEARLTHLAYAPEIASAMLRRQQAEAVIAARVKIVTGAVSMVEMALRDLEQKAVIQLDEERKAAMVSNLLVVLCGTSEASPVINTGTLYN